MTRGLCYWGRWVTATVLLNIAAVFARLARRAAPRPIE
jgi:hypothetical protein